MTRILVVDDSPTMRLIAGAMLRKLGFEVTEAGDGEQALRACMIEMPAGILLDWNMPVMDGLSLLKALRRHEQGGRPKVIFCTTESHFSLISQAISHGADEFIMKPYDIEILRSKMVYTGLLLDDAA
ncbi:MAG: response regulator [Rhodospirillaceae bacterium]|nr:response regulator [Rhodospirillaceae bacterium]